MEVVDIVTAVGLGMVLGCFVAAVLAAFIVLTVGGFLAIKAGVRKITDKPREDDDASTDEAYDLQGPPAARLLALQQ